MLSITVIVIIVAAVSGLVNVTTEEQQLLSTIFLGADQLSKAITSATWHAMLDDHREAAYEVMQTIALKQGIDRIRMFNRAGQVHVLHQSGGPGRCPGDTGRYQSSELPSPRVRIFRGTNGGRRLAMLHADLQRAFVQPGAVPRPSRADEGPRCARPRA